ncbi:MAG: D-glycerate dehydrogenase [Anaerolineales bacterium]|nr:D-glycerate dehydrogenase [Anaerolineales bacterium]
MPGADLPLVLVTHTLPPEWISSLQGRCLQVTGPVDAVRFDPSLEARLEAAKGILCLLTIPINEAILQRAPGLKVVSNMAVGVDNIDLRACTRRGIPVGNTPGVLTDGTADLAMALLLAAARRLPQASLDAREGRWTTWSPTGWLGADLHGALLGIVGLGKIGRAVAQRAKGFGLRLVYCDEQPALPELEAALDLQRLTLDELLQVSDFVSLHVPLTPQTRGLIAEGALRKMKSNAILVNTSRGGVVDACALGRALHEGWIAAAALDVTEPEPLPPDHPLYRLPNCLILPHIGSATRETRQRMAELACENLLAGLEGRRLPHCVNPEVYA